jgi:hypothetical protein
LNIEGCVRRAGEEQEQMETRREAASAPEQEWWCNFCNFKSDDQATYLAHSCTEELEKRAEPLQDENKDHCA